MVHFVKNNMQEFVFNKTECKLSDILISRANHHLEFVKIDPKNGFFIFDFENLLLIRLKLNKRSQTKPVKCSLNASKYEKYFNFLTFDIFLKQT